jgi:electron transfer flavoprotein alpha/beta subunit
MASKKKEIEIIDANKLAFAPNERCAPTGTLNQTRLSLPDRRGKGKIIDGSTNDAVMQLVKILREQEKVV